MKTDERAKTKEEYINEINGLIVSFGDVVVYVRTCTCSCVCKCRCVCVCMFMHGYESGTYTVQWLAVFSWSVKIRSNKSEFSPKIRSVR